MKSLVIFALCAILAVNAWTAIERTNREVRTTGYSCYSELEGPMKLHETRQLKEQCGTIFCGANGDMMYTGCSKQLIYCGKNVKSVREDDTVSQHLDAPGRRPFPECCEVECIEDSDYSLTTA